MTMVTIYALFGDDIRIVAFTKSSDSVFYGLASLSFICFLTELIVSWFAKPKYKLSFYFWLDLIATLSVIPDIGWIWNPIVGVEDDSSGDAE